MKPRHLLLAIVGLVLAWQGQGYAQDYPFATDPVDLTVRGRWRQ